ncbi:MAG TPA: hypothetical protein DCL54_05510 [Alphaproteobacteria bacterium]|nr:hypothetical protein [Alphaproteobacteria bacterium]HAJ46020.1 hypothetical protein [Alphaproteobacteria bacterium]
MTHFGVPHDIVGNGQEALDAVCARHYSIILMDIQMPVMDGMEAAKRIRALEGPVSRIPIIAVTAFSDLEQNQAYLAAGMNDVVAKPVPALKLHAAVASALNAAARG